MFVQSKELLVGIWLERPKNEKIDTVKISGNDNSMNQVFWLRKIENILREQVFVTLVANRVKLVMFL